MKLKATRINHITVAVPAGEHEKAREFYGDLLGLEEIPGPRPSTRSTI
jgi:4-hydroxyphenylpyruvate dioxygenase-like putative hemolysin